MQSVSKEYKDSMNKSLRNRGYMEVILSVISRDAQEAASFDAATEASTEYFAYADDVFNGDAVNSRYGTLETDFVRADGSKVFPPAFGTVTSQSAEHLYISKTMDSVSVTVIFQGSGKTFKGLTFDFGDMPPKDFTITAGGEVISVTGNDLREVFVDHIFSNITEFTLNVTDMGKPGRRLRIVSISCGQQVKFTNANIIDSTFDQYVNPVMEDLTQTNLTLTVDNTDRLFDLDNPNSIINFLEVGSPIRFKYGYELDNGRIEWVPGGKLLCSMWSSNNKVAIINATDYIRNLNYMGVGGERNISMNTSDYLHNLMLEAGVKNTVNSIDTVDTMPYPIMAKKNEFQLIANAGNAIIKQQRDGTLLVEKPDFTATPVFTMRFEDMTSYPTAKRESNIKDIEVKYYWFSTGLQQEETALTLDYTEYETIAGTSEIITLPGPYYTLRAEAKSTDDTPIVIADVCTIDRISDYTYKVNFLKNEICTIDFIGIPWNQNSFSYKQVINDIGESYSWDNVLINHKDYAAKMADKIVAYKNGIVYEYTHRGFLEIDAGDIIYQENEYVENMKVFVVRNVLNFNGAFSGSIETVRMGD